jgi:uncharacterized phage protein gp47/JayE
MTYFRPTLQEITQQIENDLYTRFKGLSRPVRFSVNKILARVMAGAVHLVYGYIDWIFIQLFIDTATGIYLDRWAKIWKIIRKPSSRAKGKVIFSGNEGTKIPAFTLLQTSDGFKFQTIYDSIILNGTCNVNIESLNTGSIGNISGGIQLNLVSPIYGLQSQCVIDQNGTFSGSDIEDDESLRSRLLDRIRNAPCAGNKKDYETWALEIPGVTRAWCYPQYGGDGNVGLAFVRDNDSGIIPNDSQISDAKNYISDKMPTTATLNIFALTPQKIDFNLKSTDISNEAKKQIIDQLKFLFFNLAAPSSTIYVSDILESLSSAKSIKRISLISPMSDITIGNTSVGIVGNINLQGL